MNVENTMCSGGGPNLQEIDGGMEMVKEINSLVSSQLYIYGDLSQHILVY